MTFIILRTGVTTLVFDPLTCDTVNCSLFSSVLSLVLESRAYQAEEAKQITPGGLLTCSSDLAGLGGI